MVWRHPWMCETTGISWKLTWHLLFVKVDQNTRQMMWCMMISCIKSPIAKYQDFFLGVTIKSCAPEDPHKTGRHERPYCTSVISDETFSTVLHCKWESIWTQPLKQGPIVSTHFSRGVSGLMLFPLIYRSKLRMYRSKIFQNGISTTRTTFTT